MAPSLFTASRHIAVALAMVDTPIERAAVVHKIAQYVNAMVTVDGDVIQVSEMKGMVPTGRYVTVDKTDEAIIDIAQMFGWDGIDKDSAFEFLVSNDGMIGEVAIGF